MGDPALDASRTASKQPAAAAHWETIFAYKRTWICLLDDWTKVQKKKQVSHNGGFNGVDLPYGTRPKITFNKSKQWKIDGQGQMLFFV